MGIGIGLHCWYCNHGPCNGECEDHIRKPEKKIKPKNKKKKRERN